MWCKFEETPCRLEAFSDTECAGCRRARRSTTGGYTVAGSHLIKMWCNTQAVVALSFSGSRIVRLSESVTRNHGTHIDVQRPLHAFERGGVGRCERSPRHCGPTETGQIEASGHQLVVDPRESCQGDLNFKKVAGVDKGADLFTKTLSWNEIQSHIHKLSSQVVQNEINVNFVGARPNGVNLPRILQEMGLACDKTGSVDSNRHELSNETHNFERWTCVE